MRQNHNAVMRHVGDKYDVNSGQDLSNEEDLDKPGSPFSWECVLDGLDNGDTVGEMDIDIKAVVENAPARECSYCHKKCQQSWWSSPAYTWQSLCGSAGVLDYCPDCQAWYAVRRMIIS